MTRSRACAGGHSVIASYMCTTILRWCLGRVARMPRTDLTDVVRTLLRRPARGAGFAVRLDWPGYRRALVCHDLTQFTPDLQRALRRVLSTERYWLRGPLQPLAVTVVPIDCAAYRTHPRECES